MESRSIAIDGPAGAGKSSLAKMTAERFGLVYVDTGAIYRSVGLFAAMNGVPSKDKAGVTELLGRIELELKYDGGVQRMFLNREDVTDKIRMPEVSIYASDVSAMAPVREYLLNMQREMATKYDVIMDGRDIGTVVLPNAGIKVFLTACPEERAKRRYLELLEKNVEVTYEKVLQDIIYRDNNDSSRAVAPLKAAEDAFILDTTNIDLNGSFKAMCEIVEKRLAV